MLCRSFSPRTNIVENQPSVEANKVLTTKGFPQKSNRKTSEERFMKKVVLLAVLALALPTVALASTVDYVGQALTTNPATVTGGVTSGGSLSITFNSLSVSGGAFTAGTVSISVTLGTTSCGTGCFNIANGTVTIKNASNVTLFAGTFSSGSATVAGNSITIQGITTGGNTVAGILSLRSIGWVGSSDTIVTPEPGTLGLLGTGLVGLAGIVRRKLRG
jgi:hypothetical protein